MARWFYRTWIKGYFLKGFLLGFIIVYMLYVHEEFEANGHNKHNKHFFESGNSAKEVNWNVHIQLPGMEIANQPFSNISTTKVHQNINANDWLEVLGSGKEYYVYSAYYDTRKTGQTVVRIIAILKRRKKIQECQLYYEDGSSERVKGHLKYIRENWGMEYIASFVICSVPSNKPPPIKVSIVKNSITLDPKLVIINIDKREQKGFMSICTKPFHYEYNRAVWLVEFIELNQLLGVDRFFFYNHTVGPDVERILQYYIEKDVVTVLPWTLPVESQKQIRTEGLFAALNDCNLRNVGSYNFTAMIDVDEFIIPRTHGNYRELINSLGDHDSYIFKNAFFYLYWDNDTNVATDLYGPEGVGSQLYGREEDGPYLLTAYKTTRKTKTHKYGERSKYITKPHKALECGNHVVWDYTDGKRGFNVPEIAAILHHYRICEYGGFECMKHPHTVDRSAHKWLTKLMERVATNCSNIFPEMGMCPKAPPLGSPW